MIKKISQFMIILLLINFITYFLVGRKKCFINIVNNQKNYKSIDSLNVFFVSKNYCKPNTTFYKNYFNNSNFKSLEDLKPSTLKKKNNYAIFVKSTFPMFLSFNEMFFLDTQYPTFQQIWKGYYVWVFYKWVLVRKEQVFIS